MLPCDGVYTNSPKSFGMNLKRTARSPRAAQDTGETTRPPLLEAYVDKNSARTSRRDSSVKQQEMEAEAAAKAAAKPRSFAAEQGAA